MPLPPPTTSSLQKRDQPQYPIPPPSQAPLTITTSPNAPYAPQLPPTHGYPPQTQLPAARPYSTAQSPTAHIEPSGGLPLAHAEWQNQQPTDLDTSARKVAWPANPSLADLGYAAPEASGSSSYPNPNQSFGADQYAYPFRYLPPSQSLPNPQQQPPVPPFGGYEGAWASQLDPALDQPQSTESGNNAIMDWRKNLIPLAPASYPSPLSNTTPSSSDLVSTTWPAASSYQPEVKPEPPVPPVDDQSSLGRRVSTRSVSAEESGGGGSLVGNKRREQNRSAQRTFRAKAKIQQQEVIDHVSHLETLTRVQEAKIKEQEGIIWGLRAENNLLQQAGATLAANWRQGLEQVRSEQQRAAGNGAGNTRGADRNVRGGSGGAESGGDTGTVPVEDDPMIEVDSAVDVDKDKDSVR